MIALPLLIAGVVALCGVAWMVSASLPPRGWWRAPPLVAAVLLCLAAAGIRVDVGGNGKTHLLLDVSASMGLPVPDPAEMLARSGSDSDGCRVLVFGENPIRITGGDGQRSRNLAEAAAMAGSGGSDLAAGLQEVARSAGRGDQVLVFTDGRTWSRGVAEAGALVRATGASIRVESGGRVREADALVRALRAPSRVAAGMRAEVEVLVEGVPGTRRSLDLRVDGRSVHRTTVLLGPSGRERVRASVAELKRGFVTIDAVLTPSAGDDVPENDRLSAGIVVGGRRRALLVNAPTLRPAMESRKFEIAVGGDLSNLERMDLLILANVRATDLPSAGRGVRDFVRGGGGLLLLGGGKSYGPGGYGGRALEECLPLRSRPEGEGLLLVLLLDGSGSMKRPFGEGEGISKAAAARDAALAVCRGIPKGTEVCVIRFAKEVLGKPEILNAGAGDFMSRMRRLLEPSAWSGGQTSFEPPLKLASEVVSRGGSTRSLVLLVTDGQVVGESEERLSELAGAVRGSPGSPRFHVLAVGEDADLRFLSRLAGSEDALDRVRSGGDMANAFIDALLRAEGKGLVLLGRHEAVDRRVPGAPFAGSLPPVQGLVRTFPRAGARTWYVTEDGDPLIAGWRYGLGKAAAVATDPLGAWAGSWSDAPVLAALADHVARPGGARGRRAGASVAEDRFALNVLCDDSRAILAGRLLDAGGRSTPVRLTAVGEGRFGGEIPLPVQGAARLTLEDAFDGGLTVPYPWEFGASGPDPEGIERLRRILGNDSPREGTGAGVGHVLALLGLAVFLLDRLLLSGLFLKTGPSGVR